MYYPPGQGGYPGAPANQGVPPGYPAAYSGAPAPNPGAPAGYPANPGMPMPYSSAQGPAQGGYPGGPVNPSMPIVAGVPFNGDINVGGQASDFGQQVHEYLTKYVGENKCPSVSVAIVRGEYPAYAAGAVKHSMQLIFTAYGMADETKRVPATPATCYRIGSLSKVFTATMMMQLVEQGRVGLDDLVQKYLPYFTPRGCNGGADVTVRHLLTHYAGLPHTIPKQGDSVYESLEALVRKSSNMRQLTPAGHTHKYSNAGLTVIGHLIERISGKNFVQYAYDHLFQPLEMHYSTFANWQLPPHIAERMAIGHSDKEIYHQPPIYGTPAGGMVSTVLDIANFISMVINRGQFRGRSILRPESLDLMIKVQNEELWRAHPRVHPPWGIGWSLGKGGFPQQRVVRHNGRTQSFTSNCIILPDKRIGIIMITNVNTNAWRLPPLSVRALQIATGSAPTEDNEADEGGDE